MIRRALIASILPLAFANAVSAQSSMERLEEVAVAMNAMMFEAMVEQTPALEGNMPSAQWSDDLRLSYVCMHDAYVAEAGEDAVNDMITAMEETLATTSPAELLQGGGRVENPAGISDERALRIVADCGMLDAFSAHMASSGAIQILMEQ